jgi:hypothetical protein
MKNENEHLSDEEKAQEKDLERREQQGAFGGEHDVDAANDKASEIDNQLEEEGLGKVDASRPTPDDPDMILGWQSLDLENLPSRGRFYPKDAKIKIRAAQVAEVRHFSTLDENYMPDINEKLNHIVESCCILYSGRQRLSYKDILEEDRFTIILAIRNLTFPEPENALTVDYKDKDGNAKQTNIDSKYFRYFQVAPEVEKYYDEHHRVFMIETKNYGTIAMRPPSIGVMQVITEYIKNKQNNNENIDQSLIALAPYIATDWRHFDQDALFKLATEMNGWDKKKYLLLYSLAEKIKIGIKPEMQIPDEDGAGEVSVPINFRGGLKGLFTLQDITEELL